MIICIKACRLKIVFRKNLKIKICKKHVIEIKMKRMFQFSKRLKIKDKERSMKTK